MCKRRVFQAADGSSLIILLMVMTFISGALFIWWEQGSLVTDLARSRAEYYRRLELADTMLDQGVTLVKKDFDQLRKNVVAKSPEHQIMEKDFGARGHGICRVMPPVEPTTKGKKGSGEGLYLETILFEKEKKVCHLCCQVRRTSMKKAGRVKVGTSVPTKKEYLYAMEYYTVRPCI